MLSRHFSWLYFVYVCRPSCTITSLSLLLECNTIAACEAYASIKLSLTLCLIMSCMVRLLSEIPARTTEWLFAAQWWLTVQTKRCPLGWAQITVTPSGASGVGWHEARPIYQHLCPQSQPVFPYLPQTGVAGGGCNWCDMGWWIFVEAEATF